MPPNLTQCHFKFGYNDGEIDPDDVNFFGESVNISGGFIGNPIQLRIQIKNNGTDTPSNPWQLYYDTDNTPSTATQVTTVSSVVKFVDDTDIPDDTPTTSSNIVYDETGTHTWQNGIYTDELSETDAFIFVANRYTDLQWNIQFDSNATIGQTYYFFLRKSNLTLNTYSAVPELLIEPTKIRYINTDSSAGGDGTTNATTGDDRAYASMNEWEAAEQANLPVFFQNHIVYCSGAADDTTSVNINGWGTSSTYTITIAGDDNPLSDFGRTTGIEAQGYVLYPSTSYGIQFNNNNITVDGVEIYDDNAIAVALFWVAGTSTNITIKNNIAHGEPGGKPNLGIYSSSSGTVYIYNNILYTIGSASNQASIRINNGIGYVYNNTVANMGGDSHGIRAEGGIIVAKNNLVTNCGGDCFNVFSGSFDSSSDYNTSDDNTNTGGDNDRINQTITFVNYDFDNPSIAPPDLHLSPADGGAIGWGTNLSEDANLPFDTDIDGDTRDTGTWDCGAHEVGAVSQMIYKNGVVDIAIYIDTDDIDRTDYIRIFAKEDINPSDINPSAIATNESLLKIKSRSDLWEESSVSDFYVFQGSIRITDYEIGRRSYFYVIYDELGNEGSKSEFFSTLVCFTPKTLKISSPTANEDETTITFSMRT